MRRTLLALLAAAALAGPAAAQTVYVVGSNNTFGSFDLGTRQYTQISSSLGGGGTFNLTGDGAGGFYGTQNNGVGNDTFVQITTAGGVTQIGSLRGMGDKVFGLAREADGTLFGYGNSGSTIGTVNPATGAYTSLGPAGAPATNNGGGALAFAGGTLYLFSSGFGGSLRVVNTTTGAAGLPVGSSDFNYSIGEAFAVGSDLYALSGLNLYAVDTTTGSLTLLGGITGAAPTTTAFYAASVASPVPEPATALGAAAAALGLAGWARRRAGRHNRASAG